MYKKSKKKSPKLSYTERVETIDGQKVTVKVYETFRDEVEANTARPIYVQSKATASGSAGVGSSAKHPFNDS